MKYSTEFHQTNAIRIKQFKFSSTSFPKFTAPGCVKDHTEYLQLSVISVLVSAQDADISLCEVYAKPRSVLMQYKLIQRQVQILGTGKQIKGEHTRVER